MTRNGRKEKGRQHKLVGQIGEYLVCAELARRNFMATPFSGNVPDFDILAVDDRLNTIPVQVKTIKGGSWQFSADDFLKIKFYGKVQRIIEKKNLVHHDLLYIFVKLGKNYGGDEFYLLDKSELQSLIFASYDRYLKSKRGIRPRNPASTHCGVRPDDLKGFRDNWNILKGKTANIRFSITQE